VETELLDTNPFSAMVTTLLKMSVSISIQVAIIVLIFILGIAILLQVKIAVVVVSVFIYLQFWLSLCLAAASPYKNCGDTTLLKVEKLAFSVSFVTSLFGW